jgi:hypothetical protein
MGEGVVGVPKSTIAYFQTWSLAECIGSNLLVDRYWREITSSLDRKAAFLIASTSIYIAVLSVVLTAVFGISSM